MSRALACSDKFRGSLTAPAATAAIAAGLRRAGYAEVREIPLADGGEGTLDALLASVPGTRRLEVVTGPLGDPVDAEWAMLRGGTAVVEMARASGLDLVGAAGNDPLRATTRGTGELIAAAARAGARHVIVGVGGSATSDGGLGALDALRWSLPCPVTVAADVTTPFLRAAEVFGPQKGATPAQVALLTKRLERLAGVYRERTGVDVTVRESGGAAGGLAGGLAAIGADVEPGFEVVGRASGLEEALEGRALVATGEGRLDPPSLEGKVVGGVLSWARDEGLLHAAVLVGSVAPGAAAALADLVGEGPPRVQVLALADRAFDAADSFDRAAVLLEEAALEAGTAARAAA